MMPFDQFRKDYLDYRVKTGDDDTIAEARWMQSLEILDTASPPWYNEFLDDRGD